MRMLYLASVWLHVVAAAAWIGALVFIAAILVPVLRRCDPSVRAQVLRASGLPLRRLGWTAFAVLAVTGVTNLLGRGFDPADVAGRLWWGPFGHALAWKLGLFALVLALNAAHDFWLGACAAKAPAGSAELIRLRRIASWTGRLNLLLTLAIVFFAVMLVRGWP